MLLPDLPYNAPVPDEVSPAARALGRDVQGLSDTMIQGATAMGQAIVQTKTIDAHLQASQKMNDLGAEIRNTPAFAPDALKARLGDSYQSQIPEEVRKDGETQVQALDKSGQPLVDANGQPVMKQKGIPNFYAAQALYQKESQAAIDGAAEQIPGVGWQGAFKRAAAQDAMGQWNQLHEHMLTAWHQDQIDSRARQILTKAYSAKTPEDWSFVNAMVEGSREIFGDDGQTKMRQQVGGLQQAKPIDDALLAFRTDPSSEAARGALKDQLRRISDPAQVALVAPDRLAHYARELRMASDKADKLQEGNWVKSQGRAEEARVYAEANADPGQALELARAIKDTRISDEVVRRLKDRTTEDRAVEAAADQPRVGRLEVQIDRRTSLDRNSQDYALLSDAGKARVEAKYNAAVRSSRVEGSEERRQQNTIDATRLAQFDALLLKGEQGQDQISADVGAMAPDVSPRAAALLQAKQNKARDAWTRDQGVSRQQFLDKVTDLSQKLGYKAGTKQRPGEAEHFRTYMVEKLDGWENANPGKHAPPPDVVNKMFGDAVLYGNDEHWYSRGQSAWQAEEDFVPSPDEKQPAKVKHALGVLGTTPAPSAAKTPAPPAGKVSIVGPGGRQGFATAAGLDEWLKKNPTWSRR